MKIGKSLEAFIDTKVKNDFIHFLKSEHPQMYADLIKKSNFKIQSEQVRGARGFTEYVKNYGLFGWIQFAKCYPWWVPERRTNYSKLESILIAAFNYISYNSNLAYHPEQLAQEMLNKFNYLETNKKLFKSKNTNKNN